MKTSIEYKHSLPASFESRLLQHILALAGMKGYIERKLNRKSFTQKAATIPKSVKKGNTIIKSQHDGRNIWTIRPKSNRSKKVILFIHGGSYILNITKYHWCFIEELITRTKATFVVPDYPLAPDSFITEAHGFLASLYDNYFRKITPGNIIFLGDSAGAGLALAFAQDLRNNKKKQPAQIILISPWLDVSMCKTDGYAADKKDKVLGIKGLKMAGKAYAGKLNPKDFRVSPLYGDFSDLGKISAFTGTHDLLIADAKRLQNILIERGIPFNFFEYPGMFHDWIIFTRLKESKHAIEQISSLVVK